MAMAALVHAWRLGYHFGRQERDDECECETTTADDDCNNVVSLDDYRDAANQRGRAHGR